MNSARSAILTYHSLDESGSVISVSPDLFRRQVECLVESRIPVVPLSEILERPRTVAITFDDAFLSFFKYAVPVLARHGLPATVFAVSAYCGYQNNWPSQPDGIPRLPLMSWQNLREVAQIGITVGAHSNTHPRLSRIAQSAVAEELRRSRQEIENRVGQAVCEFSYPYGDCDAVSRVVAAQEFDLACGTSLRFLNPTDDRFDLPRIDAYYLRQMWVFRRLFSGFGERYIAGRNYLRTLRQRSY